MNEQILGTVSAHAREVGSEVAAFTFVLMATGAISREDHLALGNIAGLDDLWPKLCQQGFFFLGFRSRERVDDLMGTFGDRLIAMGPQPMQASGAERTVSLATVLAPRIGYAAAAEIVKASIRTGRSIAEIAVERGALSAGEAKTVLDPAKRTVPGRA